MKSFRLLFPLVAFAVVANLPNLSKADDPEVIYKRCIEKLEQIVHRLENANEAVVDECSPLILELLENGHEQAAHELAERCIHKIRVQSGEAIRLVKRLCEACIHHLRELGADELAELLAVRCQQALAAIELSRNRSIEQILDLFD